ncbi:MAG TPA: hypothetical protein VFI74_01190 [Candidatus Saccharimonadales bacterium]|nr:hypothetical protein [Candidatus Saccharimonadales bacterium]
MSNTELLHTISVAAERYRPSEQAQQALTGKVFVPLIGPFATGKSTLAKAVAALDPEFCHVASFKTRPPRQDEPPRGPHFIDPNDTSALQKLHQDVQNGQLINLFTHPETNNLYGTRPGAFMTAYCMLETMPGAIDHFRDLPFDAVRPVVVICEPEEWVSRVGARYAGQFEQYAEVRKRLDEGMQNIHHCLNDPSMLWINNSYGVESAAQELVAIARSGHTPDPHNRSIGETLLHTMQELRSTL